MRLQPRQGNLEKTRLRSHGCPRLPFIEPWNPGQHTGAAFELPGACAPDLEPPGCLVCRWRKRRAACADTGPPALPAQPPSYLPSCRVCRWRRAAWPAACADTAPPALPALLSGCLPMRAVREPPDSPNTDRPTVYLCALSGSRLARLTRAARPARLRWRGAPGLSSWHGAARPPAWHGAA